jgi:hypothetical protein
MFIKYHLLEDLKASSIVKNALFHPKENVVAFVVFNCGYFLRVSQYSIEVADADSEPVFNIHEPFFNEKIETSNILQWSFDGNFLFNVSNKGLKTLSLSKLLERFVLASLSYMEDSSEILSIGCARDENCLFYGTLDGRVIKFNRSTQKKEEIKLGNKILSLCIDPLMKFVSCLTLDNKFSILDFGTLKVNKIIDLNFQKNQGQDLIIYREERKIDISPNLKYVMVPNLDDKKLPLSFCISRDSNFEIKNIFGGSFSSVNCIKFIPRIFMDSEYEYTYFAVGDAHGNIVFWELSNNPTKKETPVFMFKTDDFNVTIESIDFSRDGKLMIAVTNKKFVILVYFEGFEGFQKEKSLTRYEFIQENCGDYDFGNFEIKNYKEIRSKNALQNSLATSNLNQPVKKTFYRKKNEEPSTKIAETAQTDLQGPSKIEEAKKRLAEPINKSNQGSSIPSTVFSANEKQLSNPVPTNNSIFNFFNGSNALIDKSKQKDFGNFQVEDSKIENGYIFPQGEGYLQYKQIEGSSVLTKFSNGNELWTAAFDKPLKNIEFNSNLIIAYSEDNFMYFLENQSGKRIKMKVFIDNIFKIILNKNSLILLVKKNGSLMLYDFKKQNYLVKTNVFPLISKNMPSGSTKEIFESVTRGESIGFLLTPQNNLVIRFLGNSFTYDHGLREWSKVSSFLDFELGEREEVCDKGLLSEDLYELEYLDVLFKSFDESTQNHKLDKM